jgi:hypothetical protein
VSEQESVPALAESIPEIEAEPEAVQADQL